MPDETRQLFALVRLKHLCRKLGIMRLDAGPQAIALTFTTGRQDDAALRRIIKAAKGALAWRGERLVLHRATSDEKKRQRLALALVEKLVRE
jgi:transcription-repair coupling factor (superfamily II helicase)